MAFGGGSPMDVAKAVGVIAKYGGSITEYEGGGKVPGPIVPQIAIPTTAGTGSEVTAFSVITDHSRNYKLTVFSYELIPKYAILDPDLIATAPASVAAACGMDAFIHACESYISTDASPFSEAMSEKGDGTDRGVRSGLMWQIVRMSMPPVICWLVPSLRVLHFRGRDLAMYMR